MTSTTTAESGFTEHYAPAFQVDIEGQELDPTTKGDVLEVKVVMDLKNMTSFELRVNNWDDIDFDFKYSDTDTFAIGNRVHVQLGYADRLLSMVRGQITSLSPRFAESGPLTIDVRGQDGMVQLRDRRPAHNEPRFYRDLTDGQIAERIAERNQMDCHADAGGDPHPLVIQRDQDDATFLIERAARIDYDVFVLTDPESGDATLHFVKPPDGRDADPVRVYQLVWGESLVSFTPTLSAARQVAAVTVRGWDPRTRTPITYTATDRDLPRDGASLCDDGAQSAGRSGPAAATLFGPGRQEETVDVPVTSQQEARQLATSLLAERAYGFLTGTGRVIGLPDLRPGDNVCLQRLGTRFSGSYYVTKVEHTLGSAGYVTQFDVRRSHDGGGA